MGTLPSLLLLLPNLASSFLVNDNPLEVYLTSGDGHKQLSLEPRLDIGAASGTRITVNKNQRYQTMDGFGAAVTSSSAYVIYHSKYRHQIMRDLFGWSGISISYIRLPMGASDFQAVNPYTYDDTPNDFSMNHFSIDKDKDFIIPILREARLINPNLKIVGSPWSAPAWMKTNNNLFGGDFKSGNEYQAALALYFVKFVKAYEAEGIPIDAVTVQNEPMYKSSGYPTMGMSWEVQRDFVKNHLGPMFHKNGITTKILIFDHNWDIHDYPEHIMADPDAAKYINGSAWHCYGGRHDQPEKFHQMFPTKDIYFTECSGFDRNNNFYEDIVWAFRILMIGQPRAWARTVLLWNIALDDNHGPRQGVHGCQDCRGVVTVHGDGTYTKNFEYFNIGQMSKIVQPGAVRIDTPYLGWDNFHSAAFENPDGSIAVTVLNPAGGARQFYIDIDGKTYPYTLGAHAVVSFLKRP